MIELRKNRILCMLITLLLMALYPAACRARPLEIRLQGPADISSQPGRVVTASFQISYSGNKTLDFVEEVLLPEGWRTLLPPGSFRMGPNQRTIRLVPIRIPPSAQADTFDITYTVTARTEPSISDRKKLRVTVLPIDDVRMFILSRPEQFFPGETYELSLQVVNGGNSAKDLALLTDEGEDAAVSLPKPRLYLEPGETATVPFSVTIPSEVTSDLVHIRIEAFDRKTAEQISAITFSLHIVPNFTERFDPYYVIPTWLGINLSGGAGDDDELQFRWSGGGFINREKRQYLAFSFRGPDTSDSGTSSFTDEYWIDYRDKNVTVEVGDQSFYLSSFADGIGNGRGGGITYHPENESYEVGAHYLEGRESLSDEKEKGVFFAKQLSSTTNVRLNYLEKEDRTDDDENYYRDRITSLESEFALGSDWTAETEYAVSDTTEPTDSSEEYAYSIRIGGTPFPGGYLTLNRLYAAPDFVGGYDDEESWGTTLAFPLCENLRGNIRYAEYRDNLLPERTPEITDAQEEIIWSAFLDWTLSRGWYVNFGYDNYVYRDRFGAPDYDFAEQSYWVGVGRNMDLFSWEAEVRYGDQTDNLTGMDKDLFNYSIFVHWYFARDSVFTLYGTWGDDESMEDRHLLDNAGQWGASLTWQASRNLLLEALYRKDNFDNDNEETTEEYSLLAEYIFPSRHVLRLLYQFDRYEDGNNDESYHLTYLIPIKLKLDRREDIGALEGQVYDAQSPEGKPLEGVILSLAGQKAATDAQGRFTIVDVPFGDYYLHVDPQSLPEGKTTAEMFPLSLAIEDQDVVPVEIGIVDACVVSGRIAFMDSEPEREQEEHTVQDERFQQDQGIGSLLVELKREDTVLRRLSGQDGSFRFPAVAPGNWQLTVYDHNLPSTLKLDRTRWGLNLAGDEEVNVIARPVRRKVKMMQFEKKIVVLTTGGSEAK